ncbi:site-specific DNA-methyltransferase [Planosporangium mesophilum]|uniref:site-specific DNA-methyltransferase (cytosine-N(4)-specific) n=1 Tax=Planosporangium mesophilum TaxID=689768 RepID=A0A8J3WYG7_9ACTN|nr:site-specific DNA-methyltransferase [Planosporangium mesophilum]NJC81092.1 site-specific DNA-methyltransferase [Planosporangium mesophilum]GII21260.1 DNA modification methyltransferase [Planosporangium mesophilum]
MTTDEAARLPESLVLADATATPRRRPRHRITFEGGLDSPFHRWFRLTPSYSPHLVGHWLDEHPQFDSGRLLEPFSGAGTTCIVATRRGLDSVGFEINPFLAFVSRTSTRWDVSVDELRVALAAVLSSTADLLSSGPLDVEEFAAELGTVIPPIHNVYRWWRPDVLRQLLALRQSIGKHGGDVADHLRLALAEIVYSTANITLGRLQLFFVDRSSHDIEVIRPFKEVVARMIEDLERHIPSRVGRAQIINSDSRGLEEVPDGSIGAVFTSPPYPNRYSYVWNTRPHLYLLEFISTPREAGDLDTVTIAGTWGRATSVLQKGVVEPTENVARAMGRVYEDLHEQSLLMGNYVTKFFNDMDIHLAAVGRKVMSGAPIGYVVGNTETKGIMVETHDILASLFEANGFGRIEQDYLRARNSGAGLVEVTVSGVAES